MDKIDELNILISLAEDLMRVGLGIFYICYLGFLYIFDYNLYSFGFTMLSYKNLKPRSLSCTHQPLPHVVGNKAKPLVALSQRQLPPILPLKIIQDMVNLIYPLYL